MSVADAFKFRDMISEDIELQQRVRDAMSEAEPGMGMARLGKERGFEITGEGITAIRRALREGKISLNDFEVHLLVEGYADCCPWWMEVKQHLVDCLRFSK